MLNVTKRASHSTLHIQHSTFRLRPSNLPNAPYIHPMKSLWNPSARHDLLSRIDRNTPETRPLWGRMNAPEMIAHVGAGMKLGLGELETRPRRTLFRYWPLKHLFVYWVRFPHSAPAPREMVTRSRPVTWDRDLAALRDSIERSTSRDR